MRKKIFLILITLVILIIAVAIFLYILTPSELKNTTASGLTIRSQTWRGTITIKGDVVYAPWSQLTIEPGTKIIFDKKPDKEGTDWTQWADEYIKNHNDPTGRESYAKTHFDIYGKIIAVGTAGNRIIFTSAQTKPDYADWDQLILRKGSILEYIEAMYAHNGVNVDGENVHIKNSIIHDSLWSCVDIFATDVTVENNTIYHCWHQAIGTKVPGEMSIKNNNVHDATLGVNCENGAQPSITNNHFTAAPISPDCPEGSNNIIEEREADTKGGTYNGQLIYPSTITNE
ncbi:MAG: right-handed parallel beta-helix repeat-containing protein [Parcubacteria group bacterium]|nr:right-handed parallel beta-helix repeat-containing protein [Parcubacteria group bacterium]